MPYLPLKSRGRDEGFYGILGPDFLKNVLKSVKALVLFHAIPWPTFFSNLGCWGEKPKKMGFDETRRSWLKVESPPNFRSQEIRKDFKRDSISRVQDLVKRGKWPRRYGPRPRPIGRSLFVKRLANFELRRCLHLRTWRKWDLTILKGLSSSSFYSKRMPSVFPIQD